VPRGLGGGDRPTVWIVGGGLAGSEAALQLADRGFPVVLQEMRPEVATPAHRTGGYAELVCSNTFKSVLPDTASGAFKGELERLGSRLLPLAHRARVPGGAALALDREVFSGLVGAELEAHPGIELRRGEATAVPDHRPCLVATGPLTSPALEADLARRFGREHLYFYDAIAPSVARDSVDESVAFWQSRYDKGDADYLNCPLDQPQYERFLDALLTAERVPLKDFEQAVYFPGCMPIESIADRGRESLRFGPMRPVGLRDPRTGHRPWAVVQLRQETRDGSLLGLVGFQTQLRYGGQKEVFRLIPGLQEAEFVRLGSLHRNTFLDAPRLLAADLSARHDPDLWFAGQMVGCEGYVESLGTGLFAALALAEATEGRRLDPPPRETLLGAMLSYLRDTANARPSPMNVNFGLLPPLVDRPRKKKERKEAYGRRAVETMQAWIEARPQLGVRAGTASG